LLAEHDEQVAKHTQLSFVDSIMPLEQRSFRMAVEEDVIRAIVVAGIVDEAPGVVETVVLELDEVEFDDEEVALALIVVVEKVLFVVAVTVDVVAGDIEGGDVVTNGGIGAAWHKYWFSGFIPKHMPSQFAHR
jgi:hypothetical protein